MRKKKKVKRQIAPDPRYNDQMVAKFINHLMQSGKKTTAQKILYEAFDIIKQKTKKEGVLEIFTQAIKNASPQVEVISRRIGGAHYQIPREVGNERRVTLAMRWLIQAARQVKGKKMAQKLAQEILAASQGEGGALKKKREIEKVAEANRAFAHFAWR